MQGLEESVSKVRQLIDVKTWLLNARFYVSSKFILKSSNLIFKLE